MRIDSYDVIILNYANGDMVGHTGVFYATVRAVEVVDECIGRLYDKVMELGGTLIITADHGNSDYMLDDDNNIITSHSTSLVPFIITRDNIKLKNGKLGDIAPTMLRLLDLKVPEDMSGEYCLMISFNFTIANALDLYTKMFANFPAFPILAITTLVFIIVIAFNLENKSTHFYFMVKYYINWYYMLDSWDEYLK